MKGKTVVITGATSGIGGIAALTLAKMGARIVVVARNSDMKRVATEIADQEPRIDVLINNAGAIFSTRQLTEDDLERTFAVNHMAYFVVTAGLRERLLASGSARIVNTASEAHRSATLDFENLQLATGYGAVKAYNRSKLLNAVSRRPGQSRNWIAALW